MMFNQVYHYDYQNLEIIDFLLAIVLEDLFKFPNCRGSF